MAGRADILAGSAYVRVWAKTTELTSGLASAKDRLVAFAGSVGIIGNLISRVSIDVNSLSQAIVGLGAKTIRAGVAATGLGAAFAAAFIQPVRDASDLAETMSKFGIVFGDQSQAVLQWGDSFAASVGRAKQEVAGFLAGAQDLFVPLGFATDQATKMSKEVTTLAFDLASFNNVADADAMRDLQAALTGSGEVMKKYGVIVNETAVKQKLMQDGIDPEQATDQQKVMARWKIILGGTAAAQGDAIRTASGWANTYKAVWGAVKDLSAAIGTALLPVVTPLLARVRDIIRETAEWANNNQRLVRIVAGLSVGLVAIGGAISAAGVGMVALGKLTGVAGSFISVFGTVASAVLPLITLFSYFGPQILAIGGAALTAIGSITSFGAVLGAIGTAAGIVLPIIGTIAAVMVGLVASFVGFAAAGSVAAYSLWKITDPLTSLLPLARSVMQSLGNIGAAISKGDWSGAADAVIEGLRTTLLQGTASILTMMANAMRRLPGFINDALSGTGGIVGGVVGKIEKAFATLWPALQDSASAFLAFAGDVFRQLPAIAGYAIGRLIRAFVDGFVALNNWVMKSAVNVTVALLKTFAGFGPKLIKSMLTGDIAALGQELTVALAAAMAGGGLFSGLAKGDMPDFSPSSETLAAWDRLATKTKDAVTAKGTISGTSGAVGGGGATEAATPFAKETEAKENRISIDLGPIAKYQERLLELGAAFSSGVIDANEFSAGLEELKRDTLGLDATPLQEYQQRLQLLSKALQDGTISTAEWTREAEEAKRSILGIDPSPLTQFAERSAILRDALAAGTLTQAQWRDEFTKSRREILGLDADPLTQFAERADELKKQLAAGAITFGEYSTEFRKSQQDFLGFDSDPIQTYKNKLLELRNALSGGLITKEAFHTAAVEAIPDKIKSVIDETRTPMEKYRKEMSELQKLKGAVDPETFARKEKLLKRQYFSDLQSQGGPSNQSLVTYSATGAAAAGRGSGGGSPQERLLTEAQKAAKARAQQLEEARLARRAAEKMASGMTMR